MVLLPRKGLLAIAAVVDVASQTTGRPISGKTLAARQGLPPRHLESLLQSLVRNRLLRGIRGPNGGERNGVTVNDILRAAGIGDEEELKSEIVTKVVLPGSVSRRAGIGTGAQPDQSKRYSPLCRVDGNETGRDESCVKPRRHAEIGRVLGHQGRTSEIDNRGIFSAS
jgi:Iron-dependent Transcriptional regulator